MTLEATLAGISRLRDGLSDGIELPWNDARTDLLPPDLVCHLPPPNDASAAAHAWRARYRPGLCYYRRGPGFLQVRDTRVPDLAAAFVIDDPTVIGVFERCLRPTRLTDLDDAGLAVEQLAEERLLLVLAGTAVTLPHRMRRWPVPAYEV